MSRTPLPGDGRLVVLLAVVALVALAGCSGTAPSDSPSPATDGSDDTPVETPGAAGGTGDDTATSTASPSPTPTATPTPTTTPTPTPAGTATDTDGSGTFGAYARNLRAAGSYTVDYRIETAGNQSGTVAGTIRANLDRETLNQTLEIESDGGAGSFDYYRPPGADVFYTRLETGGRTAYRKQDLNDTQVSVFSDPVDAVRRDSGEEIPEFRDAGTVSTDDGPRRQFVVDSVERLPASVRDDYAEIRSVSWTILVDEDRGYVTDVSYELTFVRQEGGDERTVAFDLSYRDIGATTVETPSWLDEAKERTDG